MGIRRGKMRGVCTIICWNRESSMKSYRISLLCVMNNHGLSCMHHMAPYRTRLYIGPLKENRLLEAKLKKVLWCDVGTVGPI